MGNGILSGFSLDEVGMTILLLGKDGQVGWQLQRALAPIGKVLACGRVECDLGDPAAIRALVRRVRPSIIVNASAYTAVDKAESEPELATQINTAAPQILAEEAKAVDALLVHYSTDYVYDGKKSAPYVETDVVAPQSVYGRSKLAGEAAIRAVGGKSLIFRTSWVFGEHGGNFVKTILRLAGLKDELGVVADQLGNPTPAALIADVSANVLALLSCGQRLEKGENRLYHLASSRATNWCDFARCIVDLATAAGHELRLQSGAIRAITTAEYPTPACRPANSRLDCRQLEADFGLQMPDWQPYLERMLQSGGGK
jgi:dTDP-4-dehydrorhamnose reductase